MSQKQHDVDKMYLPEDIEALVKEFAQPITHPKWREGSFSAQAIYQSGVWEEYIYLVKYDELCHDADNWTWAKWCRWRDILYNTPNWEGDYGHWYDDDEFDWFSLIATIRRSG